MLNPTIQLIGGLLSFLLHYCFRNKIVEMSVHFDGTLATRMRNVGIMDPLSLLSPYPHILSQETLQFLLRTIFIAIDTDIILFHTS